MKKARRWLDEHNVAYEFHDYKKDGIDEKTLQGWCKKL
ncbi:MAG: arsenate reductase, partial [Gammaproteobacteria bacterium]